MGHAGRDDGGARTGVTTEVKARIQERENREFVWQRNPEDRIGFLRGSRPSIAQAVKYIDDHRERFGVEPICEVLQIAPSTVYAAISRPPSTCQLRDEGLKLDIVRVHMQSFNVCGAEKFWRQLNREGIPVGRDRVARLMPELGFRRCGAWQGMAKYLPDGGWSAAGRPSRPEVRCGGPEPTMGRGSDLHQHLRMHHLYGIRNGRLQPLHRWLEGCGQTCAPTWPWTRWRWRSGRVARRTSLVWFTTPTAGFQYLSIRYTERLADEGAVCTVGSRGDSYDNALAESVNGLYKTEVIRKQGPWPVIPTARAWPPPSGSSGTTAGAFTAPSATYRRRSSRGLTIAIAAPRRRRDS